MTEDIPGAGLILHDLAGMTARFGAAEEQVRRDHAISHILAALSRQTANDVVFFGGTALSRTHLAHARLSEDIDLLAQGSRAIIAAKVAHTIESGLLRSHGRISWTPPFGGKDVDAAILRTPDGIMIRVQLLDGHRYEPWPVEWRDIEQRYSDVGPARLLVPTIESFAGSKTDAWFERHAARDLYDLWALAERGNLTPAAAELFVRHGSTNGPPRSFMFDTPPTEREWVAQLAGQTRLEVTAQQALAAVREAWAVAVGSGWN